MPSPSPSPPDVRQRLRAARVRWSTAETLRGALLVVAGVGLAFLMGVAVEAALWLGVGLRTLLFWTIAALGLGLVGALVVPPVLRGLGLLPGMDTGAVAHRADRFVPGAGDRLLALLDLQSGRTGGSEALQAAAAASLAREVEDVPVEKAEDVSRVRKALPWALVPVLGFILALVAVPGPFEAAAGRLLSPGEAFYPPAPFSLVVEPGDLEVVRGETFEVVARPTGRDWPAEATLELQRDGEEAVEETRLRLGDDTRWRHSVEDLRQTVRYRVRAMGVASPWYEARVVARPLVRGLNVMVIPPGYAGREARSLPEGVGDVTALASSTVRLSIGLAGEPTARGEVRIRWDDSTSSRVPLAIGREGATARFALRRGGTYSLHLETEAGVANANPARYSLGVLGDAPPQIVLLDGGSGPLSREAHRLDFRITDDFGFSSGSLVWRIVRGDARGPIRRSRLPVRSRPLGQDVAVNFAPPVGPGDVVELFGEVVDNGPGRQRARTPVVTLRFPSLAQRIEEAEARRDSTREALGDLQRNAEEAAERFEQFRDELRRDPNPDWESQRQLQELRRRQEEMGRQSENLQQRMRQLSEDMQQSGMMDEETLRRMEEMQQVMQELDSPELREALRRLQEAMQQLDMRQMMEQVEQAEFNEQQFRERLERAMELMERLETAVDMEEAARLAEELAEREAEIQEQTEQLENRQNGEQENRENGEQQNQRNGEQREGQNQNQQQGQRPNTPQNREQTAQEQERAAEDAEALQRQMDEIRERMQEMRNNRQAEQQMNQAQDQMQQDGGMQEQMQENAQQIRENQLQDAQQGQQEMRRRLRRMAEQMREASQQMQGQQRQIDAARLRAALEDVLTLSQEQESLAGQTASTASRSPALRPLARRQAELRTGLQHVADSLRSIARTVPQLGRKVQQATTDAQREMEGAVSELAEQRSGPAAAYQHAAKTDLNELASLLADVLAQQQNQQQGGGGGGTPQQMQQQMQQMGGQQQQLNQQIQQMLNETAGQRLSRSDAQRMRQMAEQQEAIRRQLQQMLQQDGQNDGSSIGEQGRSALQRIEEQMGEAARELRRGRVDPQTLPRQQNILQRLLEAERSANEQGREEKREAETARTTPTPPRGESRPSERPADRVRQDLIRALESGFSADYQDLIKAYFDRLQDRVQ